MFWYRNLVQISRKMFVILIKKIQTQLPLIYLLFYHGYSYLRLLFIVLPFYFSHQEVPTRLLKKFSNKSSDQIHLEQNFVTERKYRITKYFSKARGVNETLFFSIDRDELSAKNSKFCDPLQAVGRLMSKLFTFVSAPPDGATSVSLF